MNTKLYYYLTQRYTVVVVMLLAPLLGFIDRNMVYFFGLAVALLILRGSGFRWARFGFAQKLSLKTGVKSLWISLVLFSVFAIVVDPVLSLIFGPNDLSSLAHVRGDLGGYIAIMLVMWIFAAFGEEFLFRGYYMKALAELLGNRRSSWAYSAVITSLYFGISHAYQGMSGMISVFLWSLCISFIFFKNRTNLWLLVLIHGIGDTIGITLLYTNQDQFLTDWVQQMLRVWLK